MIEPGKEYYEARLAAQKAFDTIKMTHEAKIVSGQGGYTFKYADLSDILPVVVPALNKAGLVLSQSVKSMPDANGVMHMSIRTRIVHAETGQGEEDEWPLPAQQKPQQTGALLSYYRRYAINAMLCLSTDEEAGDKVEGASEPDGSRQIQKNTGQVPTNSGKTKTEIKRLADEFASTLEGLSDLDEFRAWEQSPETQEQIALFQQDFTKWWYGDDRNPDYEALGARFARIERELTEKANADAPADLLS